MKSFRKYLLLIFAVFSLGVGLPVWSQEPEVPAARGHVVESGSFKVAPESMPTFMGVCTFYDNMLWPYDMGEFIYQQELARYDVDAESAAAGIVTEAALEYRRITAPQPNELEGLTGDAFERAVLRINRRHVREVRQLYRGMLRDLKEIGYTTERIELEVELLRQTTGLFSLDGTPPGDEAWRIWHSFDQPEADTPTGRPGGGP